jgi:hypothetical protein
MTEQSMEKISLTVQQKNRRNHLFSVLEAILSYAEEKRKISNNSDKVKQAWSRIAISAISTYGDLLHDVELDEINERLERLESKEK